MGKARRVHPYQWLWEPLEEDPTFLLRPMFGGKGAYLDGKLMLYFHSRGGAVAGCVGLHGPQPSRVTAGGVPRIVLASNPAEVAVSSGEHGSL